MKHHLGPFIATIPQLDRPLLIDWSTLAHWHHWQAYKPQPRDSSARQFNYCLHRPNRSTLLHALTITRTTTPNASTVQTLPKKVHAQEYQLMIGLSQWANYRPLFSSLGQFCCCCFTRCWHAVLFQVKDSNFIFFAILSLFWSALFFYYSLLVFAHYTVIR